MVVTGLNGCQVSDKKLRELRTQLVNATATIDQIIEGKDMSQTGTNVAVYPTIVPAGNLLPAVSKSFDGYGGQNIVTNKNNVYFVENLNASGAGSLLAAPANSYVVFENGLFGDIDLPDANIRNISDGNWILGQTGNIQIKHANGTLNAQPLFAICTQGNVYQNLRFRPGDSSAGNNSHSTMAILGTSSPNPAYQTGEDNVFANCSFQFGGDDNGSAWFGARRFTIQDCLISHGMYVDQGGGVNPEYGMIFGGTSSQGSFIRNVQANLTGRTPIWQDIVGSDTFNNLAYTGSAQPTVNTSNGGVSTANVEGNVMIRMNSDTGQANSIAFVQTGTGSMTYYVDDNWVLNKNPGVDPSTISAGSFTVAPLHGSGTSPGSQNGTASGSRIASTPVTTKLDPRTELIPYLLNTAGVSHARDTIDQEAIDQIRNQTDAISVITTIAGFGGHPTMVDAGVADIFDKTQTDGIKESIKVQCGLPPTSNTLTTFVNGGTSNDFIAIIDKYIGV